MEEVEEELERENENEDGQNGNPNLRGDATAQLAKELFEKNLKIWHKKYRVEMMDVVGK